jgi:hypothetical protein
MIVAFATHVRIGGLEHAKRVGLVREDPGVQVVMDELLRMNGSRPSIGPMNCGPNSVGCFLVSGVSDTSHSTATSFNSLADWLVDQHVGFHGIRGASNGESPP